VSARVEAVRDSLNEIARALVEAAGDLGTIYGDLSIRSVPTVQHERLLRRSLDEVSRQTADAMRVIVDLQSLTAQLDCTSRTLEEST